MIRRLMSNRVQRPCCIINIVVAVLTVATTFGLYNWLCCGTAQCLWFSSLDGPMKSIENVTITEPGPHCIRYSSISGQAPHARNFTVVTAYLNIGDVLKGDAKTARDPQKYGSWMWPYAYVLNGVVAYFDDSQFADAFAALRGGLPTKIVMVNRIDLWAFSMLNETARIFAQPDYPHNYPKSTNAEFVAVMHAKTELTARTVRENPFGSSYFAWMDMGVYRELPSNTTDEFMLSAPKCLCDNTVLFARVHPQSPDHLSRRDVMREGWDWVAGGVFIARDDAMLAYCADYRRHVEEFLQAGLANHDQSVIYAMYLPGAYPRPVVPLQAISTIRNIPDDQFFFLAMQLRRLGLSSQRARAVDRRHRKLLIRPCSYEMYG